MSADKTAPFQRFFYPFLVACIGLVSGPTAAWGADAPRPATPTVTTPADATTRETWEVHFLRDPKTGQRRKSGYRRVVQRQVTDEGVARLRFEADEVLYLQRFGERIEIRLQAWSVETRAGQLLKFGYLITMQPTPQEVTGQIRGDTLHCQLVAGSRSERVERPWPPQGRGPLAVEQSLRNAPLQPGQQRTIECLQPIPILTDLATAPLVATVQLTAADWKEVRLLEGSARLLRINSKTILPAAGMIESTLWSDRQGEILKMEARAMGQETLRTTREVAMREDQGGSFDIGWDGLVVVAHPLHNPHETRRVQYRVTLLDGKPADVLASCPGQQVRPVEEHTAEVTVQRIRPDTPPQIAPGKVTAADRQPSGMIQSDDPRVVAMAHATATNATDPWKIAVALEKHVHDNLITTDFSQVFASAADVARTGRGDCTEYAVLLAALCRAREIPARVAFGLIYVAPQQGFLYHMWTEVWIKDRWIPIDATLGRGGIAADHLKLSDSNLKGASAYTSLLPIANVVGRLKIDIVRAE